MTPFLTAHEVAARYGVSVRFARERFPRVEAFRNPLRYRVEDIEAYLSRVQLPHAKTNAETATDRDTRVRGASVRVQRPGGPAPERHDWSLATLRRQAGLPPLPPMGGAE